MFLLWLPCKDELTIALQKEDLVDVVAKRKGIVHVISDTIPT